MALADYNSKDLLAINRFLDTDQNVLEKKLNSKIITVAFDENAITTYEGICGLDLIIRLLSRFYPKIKIIDLSKKNENKEQELKKLAKTINHKIEIVPDTVDEDIYLIAGGSMHDIHTKGKTLYFGSDNWVSKYSTTKVQKFCDSYNPFGCGFAACLAASNIFRIVFSDFCNMAELDEEVEISVYNLKNDHEANNPIIGEIIFDDVIIAGIGAIGNGTAWALSKIKQLKGNLHLVDDQKIELSNLQRYVLFSEKDKNKIKVNSTKKIFRQDDLNVTITNGKWENYVDSRNNWNIKCVAVGIDNIIDRIGIQSSLPKVIFNAFTEPESIGISRHKNFTNEACLACSYITLDKKKDYLNEIADNCNIPDKLEMVKDYYNKKISVDKTWQPKYSESLLSIIANANEIDISKLVQFKGMKVEKFYSKFICGGVILKLSKTENEIKNVDAPLVFQSVMAGILLASELVKYSIEPGLEQEQRTDYNHLAPVQFGINPYHRPLEKDKTNHCFCRDDDFIKRYNEKWKL